MAKGTILVVGGAGYIGSQCAKELSRSGYMPVVLDDLSSGHERFVKWGPFVKGCLSDKALLKQIFDKYKFEAVMHFAANALVGESVQNPAKYYKNNVAATAALLTAMVESKVSRFVFSSTCATYGEPKKTPMPETHPQNPVNPYGRSKLMVEWMLKDFSAAYGLRSVSLRYFNAAGADPNGETGEIHEPESHLIPNVLKAAMGKLPAVSIFGADYGTPDGTCVRDYIHTVDLAQAHILALDALLAGAETTAYNLGNGKGYSVRQVIDAARAVTGKEIKFEEAPRRAGDPPSLVGSAAKIKKELGWKPKYPELKTIVEHAWSFMKNNTGPKS